jgi:hypothetical protein
MSTKDSATDNATTTTSKAAKSAPRLVGVPPLPAEPTLKAGPGQKVVTSPTGTKSVVDDEAVESLKTQGYRVGG